LGSLVRSYTWGLDIVSTFASAGGVGALLQIHDHPSGKTYLPAYDGNGNVTALLNASTGAVAASYEYGPFGEVLRSQVVDSTVADQPFRFSTKFTDTETGLVYYGHRYYDPKNGRFINRDPIEEAGGLNLYGFCGNNGVNRWDVLGHSWNVEATDYGTFFARATDAYGNYQEWNFGAKADADRFAQAWVDGDLSVVGDRTTAAWLASHFPALTDFSGDYLDEDSGYHDDSGHSPREEPARASSSPGPGHAQNWGYGVYGWGYYADRSDLLPPPGDQIFPQFGNGDNWFLNPATGMFDWYDPETGMFQSPGGVAATGGGLVGGGATLGAVLNSSATVVGSDNQVRILDQAAARPGQGARQFHLDPTPSPHFNADVGPFRGLNHQPIPAPVVRYGSWAALRGLSRATVVGGLAVDAVLVNTAAPSELGAAYGGVAGGWGGAAAGAGIGFAMGGPVGAIIGGAIGGVLGGWGGSVIGNRLQNGSH
jgi:RHS repeat-associated protein